MNRMRFLWILIMVFAATPLAMADYDAISSRGMDLSGHWRLNQAESDDAEQMLEERLAQERKRRERAIRRARDSGAVWFPPGPGDDTGVENAPVIPSPGTPSNGLRQRRYDDLRQMLGISNTLDITQSGSDISMKSQVDSRRFEAGTSSQVSMPQGELADSEVGWKGDWFIVSRKTRGGPRVLEKYRWLKKTDQLESVVAWSGDTILSGMKVHRVYDRSNVSLAPPDPAQGPVK